MESFSSPQSNLDSSINLVTWCRSWEGRRLVLRAVALGLSGVSWVLLLPIGSNRLAYIQGPGPPRRLPGLLDGLQAVPLPGPETCHSCISATFVLLSMTLFTLECETLQPSGHWPLITYTLRFYLGWLAGMLLGATAGTCLTNHLQSQTCHCWGQGRTLSQNLEEQQPSSKDDSQDWGQEILLGHTSDVSLSKVSSSSSSSSANISAAAPKSSSSLNFQAIRTNSPSVRSSVIRISSTWPDLSTRRMT
ncbi:uncharacterized protein LOC119946015 isoform X2 [Tachyglossus aculeatus]|uniref:uncharacterized protein LOC119946015 isoform X2 n=1 Tax=Tachyglossus aculeatus TaxID=9261 RepID=UPI0018F54B5A|nr:uncharacterized protein LOC119946015 isoform X2 [Tachyglossus aculeatus]